MTKAQAQYFAETACCPACQFERLKRGINLKEGWWLCGGCEIWWNDPSDG